MSYADQQAMVDRYGEGELILLTDRADPPTGEVDAGVLAAALTDADQLIDGYLGARYRLPLAEPPGLVVQWACAIARHKLCTGEPPEWVQKAYAETIAALRDAASGKLVLQVAGQVEPTAATGGVQVASREQVFSQTLMARFTRRS